METIERGEAEAIQEYLYMCKVLPVNILCTALGWHGLAGLWLSWLDFGAPERIIAICVVIWKETDYIYIYVYILCVYKHIYGCLVRGLLWLLCLLCLFDLFVCSYRYAHTPRTPRTPRTLKRIEYGVCTLQEHATILPRFPLPGWPRTRLEQKRLACARYVYSCMHVWRAAPFGFPRGLFVFVRACLCLFVYVACICFSCSVCACLCSFVFVSCSVHVLCTVGTVTCKIKNTKMTHKYIFICVNAYCIYLYTIYLYTICKCIYISIYYMGGSITCTISFHGAARFRSTGGWN